MVKRTKKQKIILVCGIVISIINMLLFPGYCSFIGSASVPGFGFTRGMYGGYLGFFISPLILLFGIIVFTILTKPNLKKNQTLNITVGVYTFLSPIMYILGFIIDSIVKGLSY